MKKKGFTLIELIAVIAILAVIAIVAIPRFKVYIDRSKRVNAKDKASIVYNAAEVAYMEGKLKDSKGNQIINSKDFDNLSTQYVINNIEIDGITKDKLYYLLKNTKNIKGLKRLINDDVDVIRIGDIDGRYYPIEMTKNWQEQHKNKLTNQEEKK